MISLERLAKEAKRAADLSYSPYSHFRVGAALYVEGDLIFSGTNVENASYGLTICAERNAIFQAVAHGYRKIKHIVIYAPSLTATTAPCGACRQVIKEFADEDTLITDVCDSEQILQFTMEELLPKAFGPDNLLKRKG